MPFFELCAIMTTSPSDSLARTRMLSMKVLLAGISIFSIVFISAFSLSIVLRVCKRVVAGVV